MILDAISQFLASPPKGTPAEILEAFDLPGAKNYIPPKILHETIEQAPVAISITDHQAVIIYANPAFERLTGYSRDEVIGKNESMLSSKSTPKAVYEGLWATITGNKVWEGILVNHRKDKEEYVAEVVISPILDKGGTIRYFLGMHRDITRLHQLEQKLKFQKSLLEAALDAAPMVIAVADMEGNIFLDNHAYKALMGDCKGTEPLKMFLKSLNEQIGFELSSSSAECKNFTNIDIRLELPSGNSPRWFTCSGVFIAEPSGEAHHYFHYSETDRRWLLFLANEVTSSRERLNEARLNMIRSGMAKQQMVQTMREAISAAIFKLQVPVNVLDAVFSMKGSGPGDSKEAVLQQIREGCDDAIESLHAAMPQPSVEDLSIVNVNEIVHEVLRLSTEKLLSIGATVDWRPTAVLPSIRGRVNALRGLLMYLLDNAIEAIGESSHNLREIRLKTILDRNEVVIELVDSGPGIPASMKFKVFEPFYCGWEQSRYHAGMGLTMAQEVALSHEGSIEIDSEFYGGCRVIVRLPISVDSRTH
ncbi:MAG: nitrogen fixation negative regulator NifL [Gammaproteobacteria bacterium]|nr:nitrogen fixation negative regulator NifL [Gammaproteobacteria bacterium]